MRALKRKLTKSRTNVILTGTLGGIAEYFGIDATIVRIIFVIVSFPTAFSTFLLYIILALIVPSGRSNSGENQGHRNPYYQSNSYGKQKQQRKEAEKVDDDDWSDF